MHITLIQNIKSKKLDQTSLENIPLSIKNGQYAEIILEIRQLAKTDPDRASELKKELPLFKTAITTISKSKLNETDQPTGLVSFDLDLKDNKDIDFNQTKEALKSLPFISYIFLSPTGGLKFAAKTDFQREDGETIAVTKERFRIAYEMVKGEIINRSAGKQKE